MKGPGHRWLRSENLCAAVDLPVSSSSRTKTDVGGNVGVNLGHTSQIVLRGLLGTQIDGHLLRLIRVIKSLKILFNPVADRVLFVKDYWLGTPEKRFLARQGQSAAGIGDHGPNQLLYAVSSTFFQPVDE